MKVKCFRAGGKKHMSLIPDSPAQVDLFRLMGTHMTELPGGAWEVVFCDLTQDNYFKIADFDFPGVPETYAEFEAQACLHKASVEKKDEEDVLSPGEEISPGSAFYWPIFP